MNFKSKYFTLAVIAFILVSTACKKESTTPSSTQKSTANTVVNFSPFGDWLETTSMNADNNSNLYALMERPGGTALSADGTSEFFLDHQYNLVKLDSDGSLVWQREVSEIQLGTKLFIDNEGHVYVKKRGGLEKFDAQGNVEEITFLDTEDIGPLAIDNDGSFYITSAYISSINTDFNKIQKFDSSGSLVWKNEVNKMRDIALSADGNSLYVLTQLEITKYQASTFTKEWSQSGVFDFGSKVDVDNLGNALVATTRDGNVLIKKFDTFGNTLFEKSLDEQSVGYTLNELNQRSDFFYLAVHSYPFGAGANPAWGDPVSHGSFIAKFDNETGEEVWRQYPQSEERLLTVYGLTDNKQGNLWTGFGFHLTWRASGDYVVKSSFGDYIQEQTFNPTGGSKYNIAALKP